MKMVRNIIKGPMHYQRVKNEDGRTEIVAAKEIDLLNYKTLKSAYNPLYPDAGKVVKIPEDYLYHNERHHLKDFVIVDGKTLTNGKQVVIGFLGTSKITKHSKKLTNNNDNQNDLIAINRIIVTQDKYKRLITKSKTYSTGVSISDYQKEIIKQLSKKKPNVKKSIEFKKNNDL